MRKPDLMAVLFAIFWLSACRDPRPPKTDFVNLYVDLRLAAQEYGESNAQVRSVRSALLHQYGYSYEQFQKETDRLMEDPQLWEAFQDSVVVRIDTLLKNTPGPLPLSPPNMHTTKNRSSRPIFAPKVTP